MNGEPLVSLLIAAYGQEQYLAETLESVMSQTFTDWEAIVVDDGSPDGVAAVADRYALADSRISVLRTDNAGVSAARNRAAARARGKYLVALDGDDTIAPGYLEACVGLMEADNTARAAFTQMRCFGVRADSWPVFYDSYERLLLNNPLYVSGMVRADDFRQAGGYDEAMTAGFEDWEFWIRFLRGVEPGRVRVADEVMFFYRQKSVSRNTEALSDATRLSSCYKHIYERHRREYDRILKGAVPLHLLPETDYWMVEPLLEMENNLRAGKPVTVNSERKFKSALKFLARRRTIAFETRCELIAALSVLYRTIIRGHRAAWNPRRFWLGIAEKSPALYVRLMMAKERKND